MDSIEAGILEVYGSRVNFEHILKSNLVFQRIRNRIYLHKNRYTSERGFVSATRFKSLKQIAIGTVTVRPTTGNVFILPSPKEIYVRRTKKRNRV